MRYTCISLAVSRLVAKSTNKVLFHKNPKCFRSPSILARLSCLRIPRCICRAPIRIFEKEFRHKTFISVLFEGAGLKEENERSLMAPRLYTLSLNKLPENSVFSNGRTLSIANGSYSYADSLRRWKKAYMLD